MPFFNCPSCNVELEADGSLSGREFTCPECGEVNKITSLPDLTEKLTHVPDANFEQGMTISEYMFKHNLEGGQDLNADTVNILPESQKGEKYAVGDMVARGGMGGILKARDLNIRRQIAMKVMLEENKPSDDDILRFI